MTSSARVQRSPWGPKFSPAPYNRPFRTDCLHRERDAEGQKQTGHTRRMTTRTDSTVFLGQIKKCVIRVTAKKKKKKKRSVGRFSLFNFFSLLQLFTSVLSPCLRMRLKSLHRHTVNPALGKVTITRIGKGKNLC
jgi:hypothetical protein